MTDKIALRQNLYSSLAQLLMGHFALDVSWTISRVQAFHLACVCDTVHTASDEINAVCMAGVWIYGADLIPVGS